MKVCMPGGIKHKQACDLAHVRRENKNLFFSQNTRRIVGPPPA